MSTHKAARSNNRTNGDVDQTTAGTTTTQLHVVDPHPDAPDVMPRHPIEGSEPMAKGQGTWGTKAFALLIVVAVIGAIVVFA